VGWGKWGGEGTWGVLFGGGGLVRVVAQVSPWCGVGNQLWGVRVVGGVGVLENGGGGPSLSRPLARPGTTDYPALEKLTFKT